MVMRGQKGYALKCDKCGHEDVAIFRKGIDSLKETKFKLLGKACEKCGTRMKIDKNRCIRF
jgi:hypothetical protein